MTIPAGPALKPGDPAPHYRLPAINTESDVIDSASLAGEPYVIYFYPKASTPGCTIEACEFQSELDTVSRELTVVGVSKDTLAALRKFATAQGLHFPLASDESGATIERFGAWGKKTLYGRTSNGILRSTFLVGPDGRILRVWRNVKVAGHAKDVVAAASIARQTAG